MDESLGEKFRKAAGNLAGRTGEVMRAAEERLGEFQETHRIDSRIQELKREELRCRNTMTDLLIRMFDQQSFAEALLKPEYLRIKEIEAEIVQLTAQRAAVGAEIESPDKATPGVPADTSAPSAPPHG
jgi:hypothetical protein